VANGNSKLKPDAHTLGQIKALGAIHCTQAEIAAVLQVSANTIQRFLADYPEAQEAYDIGKASFRVSLRRKQFLLADTNAGMAIFLGKNYLGQKDIPDEGAGPRHDAPGGQLQVAAYTAEELRQLERLVDIGREDPAERRRGSTAPGGKIP
jgi:hypothetical protein